MYLARLFCASIAAQIFSANDSDVAGTAIRFSGITGKSRPGTDLAGLKKTGGVERQGRYL